MHWQRASPSRSWTRFERQAAKQLGHGGRLDFNFDLGCQLQRTKVFAGHAFSQWVFARTLHDHADMRIDHDAHHTWPILSADGAKRYFGVGQFRLCGAQLACGNCLLRHSYVDAFSSSVILACGPIFTLLILRWKGHEKLQRYQVLGVTVAFLGVLLFLSEKIMKGDLRATGGDLVLFVASILFSYYTVQAKPLLEKHGSILTMGYATLLGGLPVMLLSIPTGLEAPWASLGVQGWVALAWSVLISAFGGWLVWGWVNQVRGVARTAPLMYLMPPVAGLFAWAITGEQYTAIKLVGAAIALIGVAFAQFAPQRKNPS